MDIKFEFRHSNLSLVLLHSRGIRSTKLIEEVIMGESFWDIYENDGKPIYYVTGFSLDVTPLVVVFEIDNNLTIITLDAKKATISEIKNDFCRFCKF